MRLPGAAMRRRWQLPAAVAVLAGLLLVGRTTAPPAPPATGGARPVDTRRSCLPAGPTRRPAGPTGGPALRPPVARLRLDPAVPRPGELGAAQAGKLARALVSAADGVTVRARYLLVTRPPALRRRPAWVVAVSGVPAGIGFCGPVGSREVVVVLDPDSGAELFRYSYR